jgi:hypothetical protein
MYTDDASTTDLSQTRLKPADDGSGMTQPPPFITPTAPNTTPQPPVQVAAGATPTPSQQGSDTPSVPSLPPISGALAGAAPTSPNLAPSTPQVQAALAGPAPATTAPDATTQVQNLQQAALGGTTKAPSASPLTATSPSDTATDVPAPTAPASTPPAITPPPATVAPTGGLPAGFTLGDAATGHAGNAYLGGKQLNGIVADSSSPTGFSYSFTDGTTQQGATQDAFSGIENAENANTMSQAGKQYQLDQSIATSSNPAMQAVMRDPIYQQAFLGNGQIDPSQITPEFQALVDKVPNYAAALAGQPLPGPNVVTKYDTGPARYLQNGLETDAQGNPVSGGYNALSDLMRQQGTAGVTPQMIQAIAANPQVFSGLSAAEQQQFTTMFGAPPSGFVQAIQSVAPNATPAQIQQAWIGQMAGKIGAAPSGAVSPTGPQVGGSNVAATGAAGASGPPMITPGGSPTGSTYNPMSIAPTSSPSQTGSSGFGAAASGIPGVGTSSINPSSDLRGQLLAPSTDPRLASTQSQVDQAAQGVSNVDRVKLAQQMYDTMASSTQPSYDLALRQATQKAAANGQLGSGMLNTSYGDLAHQRELELDNEKNSLIQNATEGSIQDALNKAGVLSGLEGQQYGEGQTNLQDLMQQQGFEQNQSQQAINNALQQYLAQLFGQNQTFTQGLEELGAGSAGNPASTYLQGAASYGGMTPAQLQAIAQGIGANSVPQSTGG